MTIDNWLRANSSLLATAGIDTARLDTLVLLEDCLCTNRALLLAHPERELTNEQITILDEQIVHRTMHEPLAYIRGRSEFYGRVFIVDKNVLVPRPESETIIDLLKKLPPAAHKIIVDVGTGSGALAITAKSELPDAEVIGIDIDPACLYIARRNAEVLSADVSFLQSDLLQSIGATLPTDSTLLCNLPYVPDEYIVNRAATHEPALALFAGTDGLDLFRKLFNELGEFKTKPSYILTESLPEQHDVLSELATAQGYQLQSSDDFIQIFSY